MASEHSALDHVHIDERAAEPVLVEVTRGAMVESSHRGSIVVVDAKASVLAAWGDHNRLVYPRSAIKPLQAIALVESGAADAFGLSGGDIALACASHTGEPAHVTRVQAWIARQGLGEADLECGAHWPADEESARELAREGRTPSTLHNNCSGKHAAMLTVARHMAWPTAGYIAPTHRVQQTILGCLEQMSGLDLGGAPRGRDGCGIPVYGMSLGALALAFARFADPRALPQSRAAAIARIRRAMAADPYAVGGRGRFDTALIAATEGRILSKSGAEGVACACVPEAGIGIAIKIADGAGRAASVVLANLLARLHLLGESEKPKLADYLAAPIANAAGLPVGAVRATL